MTSCGSASKLGDETLLAYMDGEADDQVVQHLAQCPHCRERVRELARLHDRLMTELYRLDCPDPAQLGEYHLNMLSQAETEAVARHLSECAHCAQEVAQLETYIRDLAPDLEPGWVEQARERARVLVATLVRKATSGVGSSQPALAPAFAGLRGDASVPQVYEAEEIGVSIESQPDAGRPGRWSIVGLVFGFDNPGAEALLWQEGARLASQPISNTGDFYLEGLAPGAYDLVLCAGPTEVHIRDVEVGGASGRDPTESDRTTDQPDRD